MGLDEISVDWTQFLGGLIAIVGKNGSGKTTILDNCHPFRKLGSRAGSLQTHIFKDGSLKELEFEFEGKTYLSRVELELGERTQRAYLSEDGVLLNDGKTSTYDEVVTKLFGSERLFFNSVFSSQHRQALTELTKGERKALFVELLGLDYLQTISDRSKEVAQQIDHRILRLDGQLLRVNLLLRMKALSKFTQAQCCGWWRRCGNARAWIKTETGTTSLPATASPTRQPNDHRPRSIRGGARPAHPVRCW
jgi:exonuclease SbcC